MKIYSLRKSKKILLHAYYLWKRKKKKLLPGQMKEIQLDLKHLQDEILSENRNAANIYAHKCHDHSLGVLKKSVFEQIKDFIVGILFAFALALLIRQVWFELYEIPTGSMRPTLKEKDRLIVSKTNFGINIPFTTKHLYFDPALVKRSEIIVFSVENMNVRDPDTLYFWLFPGKKQFVKRMMGKPGDTVYFYGGKIYGMDQNQQDITAQLQPKDLHAIDYVPFIRFEGNVSVAEPFRSALGPGYRMTILHQMNEPIARLNLLGNNRLEGELLSLDGLQPSSDSVKNYYELWGIENFALARIVTKEEVRVVAEKNNLALDENLYLELKHHPNLKNIELGKDAFNRVRPQFVLSTSIIPLKTHHLQALFHNLYTARFIVKNGYAVRYGLEAHHPSAHFRVRLEGVPDGTYEYYYGQAYQIQFGGIAKKLSAQHPLQIFSPELVQKLFNFGIDFDKRLGQGPHFDTGRVAYYRDEDLFTMNGVVFDKGDPLLIQFKEGEKKKEGNLTGNYIPFLDIGPPLTKEGNIDVEKLARLGLQIPALQYLALGDNYAMSADSRDFGFVPEGNLKGSPSFIFWPPGNRFGPPLQVSLPWVTLPNMVVWLLAVMCFIIWRKLHQIHHRLPLKDL